MTYFFQGCTLIPPEIIRKHQFSHALRVGNKEGRGKDMG